MNLIYLDNAATTQIDQEVLKVMHSSMQDNFGNPSSTHQFGRRAKSSIEIARKNIAKHFNTSASEIIFTAGGTEADNLILYNAVLNLGVKRIITSKIEHHAVLNTCNYLKNNYNIIVDYVALGKDGRIDIDYLEKLLSGTNDKTLLSLMHINNEIGTILPIDKVCFLCKKYKVLFHSDTVQAIGHYTIDVQKTPVDFITASAHKFHGPKGVGFAYFNKEHSVLPMLYGGNQEKGVRSGTENVHAILGMEKALELAILNIETDRKHIEQVKEFFIDGLKKAIYGIAFNGLSSDLKNSSYTILNVRIPTEDAMLLFSLDMAGIAISGGSACQSGSAKKSHVLVEILDKEEINKPSIRFSFSKYTTKEEIVHTILVLKRIIKC